MRSSSSSLFLSLVLLFIPFHAFFFFLFLFLSPLFFLSRGGEKRLTSHENRWLRSHLIIGIEFSFEERSSLPYFSRRTYMDIRICYYGQFLLSFFFFISIVVENRSRRRKRRTFIEFREPSRENEPTMAYFYFRNFGALGN